MRDDKEDNIASHEHYYIPAQSKWLTIASTGLLVTVFGLGIWFNDLTAGHKESHGPWVFSVGGLIIAYMLFGWFGNVTHESRAGLYNVQMDRSFRWGTSWPIFSEVMLSVAFFGALFYVRHFVGPWLDGEGAKGVAHMFWPNFQYNWPLLQTPDPKLFPPSSAAIESWKLSLINTILLVTSSFTVTFAHHALKKNKCGLLKVWLMLTVLLGIAFPIPQAEEYAHAYNELGLTLGAGIYGSTFFTFTGFHDAHVTLGTLILGITLARIPRGHFDAEHHFGFEAISWYWHFADVVWIDLFIFAYVIRPSPG